MVRITFSRTPRCLLYKILTAPFMLVAALVLLPFEVAGQCCVVCCDVKED